MEELIKKLDELIRDDDKIVTITSYALIANVSYEQSQKAIDKYVEVNKECKQIYVTYILNGIKKGTKELSVMLVSEEALNDVKQLFEDNCAVVIFSIQKTKHIDYNIICLSEQNSDIDANIMSGAIVGQNCIKRVLRKNVLSTLPSTTIKGKSTIFAKQNISLKTESESKKKDGEVKRCNEENIKTKMQPQSSITSMFSKAAQIKKPDTKHDKSVESKTKKDISSFFPNLPKKENILEKKDIKVEEKEDEEPEEKGIQLKSDIKLEGNNSMNIKNENLKSDLFDSDTDDEILKDLNVQENMTKSKALSSKNKKNTSQKKKREKADVGNDKSAKRRKRIIVDENSDSDDIFGSDKSDKEDIVEKFDEEPEFKNTEIKSLPPRNKRRRAVNKAYEDSEGYLVTQIEYVYETASEDENDPTNKVAEKEKQSKPKLEKKSNSETEISQNKNLKSKKGDKKTVSGYQPTMMNFFTRK